MTTALTAQLQRLTTPQTSTLVESRSRYSILYESKDAANIDLQTIFDQSKSGLEELISKNSAFSQFKHTLFNESTINLERSVETDAVNKTLNENIKKFLFHLSPHFLVKPAHYCLEWLIRRYRINEYNVDDMMALILPYHETMMFVKCLQTIPLNNNKNSWYWLKKIRKGGVPLTKPILIKRAARYISFLKFIWETTSAAVKELNRSASTLHALFAFYATVTLGAFDGIKKLTSAHRSNITRTLSEGLSSDVADFRAASMIVVGVLVTKWKFDDKFLMKIVSKLFADPSRHKLTRDPIVLLIMICRTQSDRTDAIVEEFLSKMVDDLSVTATLGELCSDKINVMPLSQLILEKDDANALIRCILKALKRTPSSQPETINIDDDDEDGDVDMDGGKKKKNWHSVLYSILETRFSAVLDAVKDDILSSQDDESSSLKVVLGALLCSSFNADTSGGVSIDFVDLYHPSAFNRVNAVRKLVNMNKLSSMPYCDDKKNWLLDAIGQRLTDDCATVVNEVLQFTTEDLIKIVGEQNFFLVVMDFRSKYHRICKTVDAQEDCFFKTLIGFVMKLHEATFQKFYPRLREWSNENIETPSYDRAITFYRLTDKVAESLKSLFISFASLIIQHAADLLRKDYTEAEIEASSARPGTLIYNILSTLQKIFLLSDSFINEPRFTVLMEPLVNILKNEEYLMDEAITGILPKCLGQFGTAANNDMLWKQLNREILMNTQSNSVLVRRWALICSTEVVTQLGEDSLQLYPEMIPFFSELLEDEDTEIQRMCNRSITEIERATGEDLRSSL